MTDIQPDPGLPVVPWVATAVVADELHIVGGPWQWDGHDEATKPTPETGQLMEERIALRANYVYPEGYEPSA